MTLQILFFYISEWFMCVCVFFFIVTGALAQRLASHTLSAMQSILFAVGVTPCVVLHLSSSVKVYSACTCILAKCNGYNCIPTVHSATQKYVYVEELHTCDALQTQNKQNLYHSLRFTYIRNV